MEHWKDMKPYLKGGILSRYVTLPQYRVLCRFDLVKLPQYDDIWKPKVVNILTDLIFKLKWALFLYILTQIILLS